MYNFKKILRFKMTSLNLTHFKNRTTADYIDHCSAELDRLTRHVFSLDCDKSSKANLNKDHLIKLFNESIKQLSCFLEMPSEQRLSFTFKSSLSLSLQRINQTTLDRLNQLILTLKGEQDREICYYPLPLTFTNDNDDQEALAVKDQQEIQEAVIAGVSKKVSTLLTEIKKNKKSLEKDASEAAAAKAEISKSEQKRKLDERLAISKKASTREGAFALIHENPMHLAYVKALQDDFEIVQLAVKKDPQSIQFASPRLKRNPVLIKLILQHENSDNLLQFISQESMQDRERLLAMVRDNELALSYAVDDGYDLDFLLETLLENPMCYQVLNEALRNNKEIFDLFMMLVLENEDFEEASILHVLPQNFHPLARAYFGIEQDHTHYLPLPDEIKNDTSLIAYYFSKSIDEDYFDTIMGLNSLDPHDENLPEDEDLGDFFEFINDVPQPSRAFARCLCEARLLHRFNYSQLPEELKNNIHVILHALKSDNIRFEELPDAFKSSTFYLKLLVKTNVTLYQHLPEEQRNIPSLAKIALSKDLTLFQHVPSPLNQHEDFIIEILEAEAFDDDDDMPYTFLTSLPVSIRHNERVILAAIEHISYFYICLSDQEQQNPVYAFKAAECGCFSYIDQIPAPLKSNRDLLLKALSKTPSIFIGFPAELKGDEDFLYLALEKTSSIFRHIDYSHLKDINRLYTFLSLKLHQQQTAYLEDYLINIISLSTSSQKLVYEALFFKILQENEALTKALLKSPSISRELKQHNTRFLKIFRTFFLRNPEKFKIFASIPKSEMALPEDLLLDLIGHDSSFYSVLHTSYLKSPFIKKAIKANSEVYEKLIPSVAKNHPPFKAARALSIPYFRPLD